MNKLITRTLALGFAIALTACGSDDSSSDDTSAPADTSEVDAGDAETADTAAAPSGTASGGDTPAVTDDPTVDTGDTTVTEDTAVTEATDGLDITIPDISAFTSDTFPEFVPGDQLPGLSYAQSQVIHLVRQAFATTGMEGINYDEDCFIDVVSQLSDADAELIVEAGFDGDIELSPEGEAIGEEAEKCITFDEDLIDDTMTSTT